MNPIKLILFDGVCNFCCGWVQFLIRIDKDEQLKFASLQSETAKRVLAEVGLPPESIETVIYLKGNQFFYHSAAVLEILQDIGGVWSLAIVFRLIPNFIRDRIYYFFASRRYKLFGKRSSCMLVSEQNEKRFLF